MNRSLNKLIKLNKIGTKFTRFTPLTPLRWRSSISSDYDKFKSAYIDIKNLADLL